MKRLLVVVLAVFLVGCTSTDVKKYQTCFDQELIGDIKLVSTTTLESGEEIVSQDAYQLSYTPEISQISDDSLVFVSKDDVSFMIDGDKYFRYEDYGSLLDRLLPLDFNNEDIQKVRVDGNNVLVTVKEAILKDLFGFNAEDELLSQSLKWEVDGDLIVSEYYEFEFKKRQNVIKLTKYADYHYQEVTIDTDMFAYQDQDYSDFVGVCRFDDAVVEDIEIVDNQVKKISRTINSVWDKLSFIEDEKDVYLDNLYKVYGNIEGVDFSLSYDDSNLVTYFEINVDMLDDASLKLLNIKQEGNAYIHDLYSRGFGCK